MYDNSHLVTIAYNVLLLSELHRLLKALQAQGILVIVLKGPVLGQILYDKPVLRPMGDLDLLTKPEDQEKILSILQESGYILETNKNKTLSFKQQFSGEVVAYKSIGVQTVCLDLHRHLINIEWYRRTCIIDTAELWDKARPFCLDGEPLALQLTTEHLLLHHCIHAAVHHISSIQRYTWEIAGITHHLSIQWDALVRCAKAFRVATAVYWSLWLAKDLEGALVPEKVLNSLKPLAPKGWALKKWTRLNPVERPSRERVGKERVLFHLLLIDRWQDVVKVIRFALLPELEWVQERYCLTSRRQALLYYPQHWGRILGYGCQATAQMLHRFFKIRSGFSC